jgi:SAM-dependent methyltransferase
MSERLGLEAEQRAFNDLSVYEATGECSPFSVFLRYTNEKAMVGKYLATEFSGLAGKERVSVLDVGCGDGSLAAAALEGSLIPVEAVDYHGIDPVAFNTTQAGRLLDTKNIKGTLMTAPFEGCTLFGNYDIILASNLYHMDTADVPGFVLRLQELLAPSGKAYFIYRADHDDVLDFRRTFEAPLYATFREPRTIKDVLSACESKVRHERIDHIRASLQIPEDAFYSHKIIEFILNTPTDRLEDDVLNDINAYFVQRSGNLNTMQAVMVLGSRRPKALVAA